MPKRVLEAGTVVRLLDHSLAKVVSVDEGLGIYHLAAIAKGVPLSEKHCYIKGEGQVWNVHDDSDDHGAGRSKRSRRLKPEVETGETAKVR